MNEINEIMEDYRSPVEKKICGWCKNKFRESDDCRRCYISHEIVRVRDEWAKGLLWPWRKDGCLVDDLMTWHITRASRLQASSKTTTSF